MATQALPRNKIIGDLVANCDCWKDAEGKEILANFSDEKLQQLHQALSRQMQANLVANTAATGFTAGDVAYRVNPESGKWEFRTGVSNDSSTTSTTNAGKSKAEMDDEEEDATDSGDDEAAEGETDESKPPPFTKKKKSTNNSSDDEEDVADEKTKKKAKKAAAEVGMLSATTNTTSVKKQTPQNKESLKDMITRPLTTNEWLAIMPPEAQPVWNHAVRLEERERQSIVDRLTVNLADEISDRREHPYYAKLMSKPLEELQQMLELIPTQNSNYGDFMTGGPPPMQPLSAYSDGSNSGWDGINNMNGGNTNNRRGQGGNGRGQQQPHYFGAAAPTSNANNHYQGDSDDVLPLPELDWAEMVKEDRA